MKASGRPTCQVTAGQTSRKDDVLNDDMDEIPEKRQLAAEM